jgi:hypothetical protein
MSKVENRSTAGRRRLTRGGLLAMASALTMLVATPAAAASAPTTPAHLHPVFVDGVLNSIAWDASSVPGGGHVSYIVYLNGPAGPSTVTQTSRTSRTVRDLILVDCLHRGATLRLSVRALASDPSHSLSGFSEQLEVTLPKTVPPRG